MISTCIRIKLIWIELLAKKDLSWNIFCTYPYIRRSEEILMGEEEWGIESRNLVHKFGQAQHIEA